jgi:hypothetical protein
VISQEREAAGIAPSRPAERILPPLAEGGPKADAKAS